MLDVPLHKTGTVFSKPVDPVVGHAMADWEAVRPDQPLLTDGKTGEPVAFLFAYRGKRLRTQYLNLRLIPMLCRKAACPPATPADGSPATAPAPPSPASSTTPRNVRTIAVLLDREAVERGAAGAGAPWQYFDLGHGYCTYSFFEQCPHRMACARCDFYLPKSSTRAQLLEAKANLQRMLVQIPLTDDERAAVEDGTAAVERLLDRLADTPTPAGPTPTQIATAFIPLATLDERSTDLTP